MNFSRFEDFQHKLNLPTHLSALLNLFYVIDEKMLIIKHHLSHAKGSRLALLRDTLTAYSSMQWTLHSTVNFI